MQDGKHVILVVDDDPDIIAVLKIVLEKNGYIAETAETAEEGLKVFKEVEPDLIITDLMMEEIDAGTNFVKELKAVGNTAPIYVLSSTGDNLNQTVNASELGLDGVFQKPIDPNTLLTILKTKLG